MEGLESQLGPYGRVRYVSVSLSAQVPIYAISHRFRLRHHRRLMSLGMDGELWRYVLSQSNYCEYI